MHYDHEALELVLIIKIHEFTVYVLNSWYYIINHKKKKKSQNIKVANERMPLS